MAQDARRGFRILAQRQALSQRGPIRKSGQASQIKRGRQANQIKRGRMQNAQAQQGRRAAAIAALGAARSANRNQSKKRLLKKKPFGRRLR